MLDGRDRHQLEQIEHGLRADDPDFATRFEAPSHRGRVLGRPMWRVLGAMLGVAAISAFLLGQGLAGTAAATLAIGLLLVDHGGWRLHAN